MIRESEWYTNNTIGSEEAVSQMWVNGTKPTFEVGCARPLTKSNHS